MRKTGLRQGHAPVAEAMRAYAADGALAFHTPGHKQGRGAHHLLQELIAAEGLREEVSLMEELDDLHEPTGCIREAEQLAAELYGAAEAHFCINGTTGAIQGMLLAALAPGDKVLVPRNAHKSIVGALTLTGARQVWLQPEYDARLGTPLNIAPETVRQAVKAHPEAKALVLVYPTYYGVTTELAEIADFVHERGLVLLVDEAHGPHLPFSGELPREAIAAGADIAAVSTHKILGSLTQTSMLLVHRDCLVDRERIRESMSMLQSTSPNQLLLASLDIARLQMAEAGKELVGRAVRLAEELRGAINALPGLWSPGRDYFRRPGASGLDATKITVSVAGLGLSGPEAEHYLRHEQKIQCELSDARNLLFIISYADTEQETSRLLAALQALAASAAHSGAEATVSTRGASGPILCREPVLTPREAFFADKERIAFDQAPGRIAAEQVMFYPPGIPLLVPGDLIDSEMLSYIREQQALGLKVVGPSDCSLQTLKVVKSCRAN